MIGNISLPNSIGSGTGSSGMQSIQIIANYTGTDWLDSTLYFSNIAVNKNDIIYAMSCTMMNGTVRYYDGCITCSNSTRIVNKAGCYSGGYLGWMSCFQINDDGTTDIVVATGATSVSQTRMVQVVRFYIS